MSRPVPHQWLILFFVICIGLILFNVMRLVLGTGSVPALFATLCSTCIVASQLFKRAILILWGIALVCAAIALVLSIGSYY